MRGGVAKCMGVARNARKMRESGAKCAKCARVARSARRCSEVYESGVKWNIQAENGALRQKVACARRKSLKYLTNSKK